MPTGGPCLFAYLKSATPQADLHNPNTGPDYISICHVIQSSVGVPENIHLGDIVSQLPLLAYIIQTFVWIM